MLNNDDADVDLRGNIDLVDSGSIFFAYYQTPLSHSSSIIRDQYTSNYPIHYLQIDSYQIVFLHNMKY